MQNTRNSLIVALHSQGISHSEIARQVDLSRERVRQIVKELTGTATPLKFQPSVRRDYAITAYYKLESGLDIATAATSLGLSATQLSQLLIEQFGVKRHVLLFWQWMSTQIGAQYGYWTILSIAPARAGSTSKARCRAKARCELCGTVHTVIYANMASGCSTMCLECGRKSIRRKSKPVKDDLTGNIYSSIQEASESLGITYNQARYRTRSPKTLPSLIPVPHLDLDKSVH
jgi:AraC-like DNA-binding protein